MSGKPRDLDQILDQALSEINQSEMDPRTEKAAAGRVWDRVREMIAKLPAGSDDQRQIRDCSDFQALIPAYLRDGLSEAKALLLEDHVGECLPCRRTLKKARSSKRGGAGLPQTPLKSGWLSSAAWKVAAAAAVFLALIGLSIQTDLFTIEAGGLIRIESIQGEVFQITEDGAVPVSAGDEISFEDVEGLRTGKEAGAILRLADNTTVEMNERAELAVNERRALWNRGRGDSVIDLDRGNIIVQASDQGSGHLYVDTNDCRVAVTGTVFAVNNGFKGSRVSVIEGEVEVAYSGNESILHPGEQATTNPLLAHVPVEVDIAWSRNLEHHLALLHEFSRVTREIERELVGPGLRYSTDLLDRSPAGTVIFVGIPNVSSTLGQAYDLLQQKIASNDLLQQWWQDSVAGSEIETELERMMDKIRSYGEQFGEEIAVTLQLDEQGEVEEPLILARLIGPDAFRALLNEELAELAASGSYNPDVCIFDGEQITFATGQECDTGDIYLWISDGYLAVAPDIAPIQSFAATMQRGGRSAFAATPFHSRLTDMYRDGVEWIVALDLERIMQLGPDSSERESLERMGLLDLQYVIAERKELGNRSENRALLTFDQPRRGLAAWLAAPAPMGALDFISAEAYLAGGFVMKEPATVVRELFEYVGAEEADFERSLEEFEREHDIDIREDIAAALGGEFAFALDGPILPKPSWKLVMEVYNPSRLQATLEWATGRLNQFAQDAGARGFSISQQESGGRVYYEIQSLDTGISAHYMFADGYLVASASRALLERSLQTREAGFTLTRSPHFSALLPRDGEVNFSAVVYHNMGPALAPLSRLSSQAANFSPEVQEMISGLGSMAAPNLTLAYGGPNSIAFVNISEGGILTSSLGRFLSLQSLLDVQQLIGQAVEEGTRDHSGHRSPDADAPVEQHPSITEG
jgi:hypothetical protein